MTSIQPGVHLIAIGCNQIINVMTLFKCVMLNVPICCCPPQLGIMYKRATVNPNPTLFHFQFNAGVQNQHNKECVMVLIF